MLGKNRIKHLNSLKIKKYRDESGEFIAEGNKLVNDILASAFNVKLLIATENWLKSSSSQLINYACEIAEVKKSEIERFSLLKNPPEVAVVVEIPKFSVNKKRILNDISLVLDTIQDPGNMGTIIRIADWFGIKNIFCTENTVDVYNPKVIQATMGSITRVEVYYPDVIELLEKYSKNKNFPVYGTFLTGKNIYTYPLSKKGFIILGNEGSGIAKEYLKYITEKIFIPSFPGNASCSESLNVSVAAGIICSEFRRRIYTKNEI